MNDKIKQHKKAEIMKTFRLSQENDNIVLSNAKASNCTQNYFINNLIQKASNDLGRENEFLNIVEEFVMRVCEGFEYATSMDDVCCPEDFLNLKEQIIQLKGQK